MALPEDLNEKEKPDPTVSAKETTQYYTKQLWNLILRYSGFDQLTTDDTSPSNKKLKKRPKTHSSFLLSVLKTIPWVLGTIFFLSFFWDFQGISVRIPGASYPLEGLLKVVSVSGLIGFFTNWLAITMLFRPASKRPILGQGLIPAHKERVAYRLAHAVSEDLINPDVIKKKIRESNTITRYRELATDYLKSITDNTDFRSELKMLAVEYINSMIADPDVRTSIAKKVITEIDNSLENRSFEKVAVKTYTFLRGKEMQDIVEESLKRLPASVESGLEKLDDLLDELPAHIDRHSESVENVVTVLLYRLINQLDVHSLVEENLRRYDERKLEEMIKGATHEQLTYIKYLGAVLGTIGGFVIWQPLFSLAVLGVLLATILTLDHVLLKISK